MRNLTINGKVKNFYSFATKYCSHHNPDAFPIYDSYVDKILVALNKAYPCHLQAGGFERLCEISHHFIGASRYDLDDIFDNYCDINSVFNRFLKRYEIKAIIDNKGIFDFSDEAIKEILQRGKEEQEIDQ